jgi:hypothetical protein
MDTMNRPKKIIIVSLGIAASLGLWSLIASPSTVHETRVRACCTRNGPARYSLVSDSTSSETVCLTSAPEKLQKCYFLSKNEPLRLPPAISTKGNKGTP